MSIPKIIHYCWFGRNPKPELAEKCISSWRKFCPNYEIIEWNEENFDVAACPIYVQQAYEAKKWAFVTDYVRLKVVYDYGGIYLDTDVELKKGLDLLLPYSAYFGFEDDGRIATGLGFGAETGTAILAELMHDYEEIPFILKDGSLDLLPCPQRNTEVFLRHGLKQDNSWQVLDAGIQILPSEYLCPVSYKDGRMKLTKKTISIHWFSASWQLQEERERFAEYRRYIRMFGERNGELLLQFVKTARTDGITDAAAKTIRYLKRM